MPTRDSAEWALVAWERVAPPPAFPALALHFCDEGFFRPLFAPHLAEDAPLAELLPALRAAPRVAVLEALLAALRARYDLVTLATDPDAVQDVASYGHRVTTVRRPHPYASAYGTEYTVTVYGARPRDAPALAGYFEAAAATRDGARRGGGGGAAVRVVPLAAKAPTAPTARAAPRPARMFRAAPRHSPRPRDGASVSRARRRGSRGRRAEGAATRTKRRE